MAYTPLFGLNAIWVSEKNVVGSSEYEYYYEDEEEDSGSAPR